jgi:hypothetical protein
MTGAQALAVRRTADGDAKWFIDHPERSYRVRFASEAEIAMLRQACGIKPIPAGPHSRCTALSLGKATNNADGAAEEKAKALFTLAVSRAASPTTH